MSLEAMLTKGDVGGCSETMRRLAATFEGPSVTDPYGTFVSCTSRLRRWMFLGIISQSIYVKRFISKSLLPSFTYYIIVLKPHLPV